MDDFRADVLGSLNVTFKASGIVVTNNRSCRAPPLEITNHCCCKSRRSQRSSVSTFRAEARQPARHVFGTSVRTGTPRVMVTNSARRPQPAASRCLANFPISRLGCRVVGNSRSCPVATSIANIMCVPFARLECRCACGRRLRLAARHRGPIRPVAYQHRLLEGRELPTRLFGSISSRSRPGICWCFSRIRA